MAAVVYGEIFDWPLTASEARFWAINTGRLGKSVEYRPNLSRRAAREKIARAKTVEAKTVAGQLAKIPTIEGIFLTGSVVVGNATPAADIDLMIVTSPGTMWLTRLAVALFLKWKGLYRHICPNIFLDTDHLEVKEKNLYTAHEVLQAKCLFDRNSVAKKWLRKNLWTKKYLPKAYETFLAAV